MFLKGVQRSINAPLEVVSKFEKRWQLLSVVVRAAAGGSFGTTHQVVGATSSDASSNHE